MRDKQKEAPEGRSGRRRDRAAGAQGLPAGRPGAAGPGEWVGWGKERELSPLRIHSFTPPASCSVLGAPGSPGSALWGSSLEPPAAVQFCLRPGSPSSWVSGAAPSPRCRGARAPSQAPRASLRSTYREFPPRLPRSPCHPLGSPISLPLHTHTPPFIEVPPLGSLLSSSFSFSKVLFSWAPGPLPPHDPAGTVPRLGDRIFGSAFGACLAWGSWEDQSSPGVCLCPVHPDGPGGQI